MGRIEGCLDGLLRFAAVCYAAAALCGTLKLIFLNDWMSGLSFYDISGMSLVLSMLMPKASVASQFQEDTEEAVIVFHRDLENVSCYRIPAIVSTEDESLLAFAEARHGSCSDKGAWEIALRRSIDRAMTWSAVSFIVGGVDFKVGNPMPIVVKDANQKKSIMLLYVMHDDGCTNECGTGNGIIWSRDDGLTWSAPQDVSEMFGVARGGLPGPGSAIQVRKSGRLLVALHLGKYFRDYVVKSDDYGVTWSVTHEFISEPPIDEPALAELPDGRIHFSARSMALPRIGRAVAFSSDQGASFSEISFDCGLRGAVCQGSSVMIGQYLYFAQPLDVDRGHLAIRRSSDGEVWDEKPFLVQAKKSFGYSSLAAFPSNGNGTVTNGAVLYEYGRWKAAKIAFKKFPLHWP